MSNDLDQEYSETAARQAKARAAEQRRIENDRLAQGNQPIDDAQALAEHVAHLAGAWGLKKKRARR